MIVSNPLVKKSNGRAEMRSWAVSLRRRNGVLASLRVAPCARPSENQCQRICALFSDHLAVLVCCSLWILSTFGSDLGGLVRVRFFGTVRYGSILQGLRRRSAPRGSLRWMDWMNGKRKRASSEIRFGGMGIKDMIKIERK